MAKVKLRYPTVAAIVRDNSISKFKITQSETSGNTTEVLVNAVIPIDISGDVTFESFMQGLMKQGFLILNPEVLNKISKAFEETVVLQGERAMSA